MRSRKRGGKEVKLAGRGGRGRPRFLIDRVAELLTQRPGCGRGFKNSAHDLLGAQSRADEVVFCEIEREAVGDEGGDERPSSTCSLPSRRRPRPPGSVSQSEGPPVISRTHLTRRCPNCSSRARCRLSRPCRTTYGRTWSTGSFLPLPSRWRNRLPRSSTEHSDSLDHPKDPSRIFSTFPGSQSSSRSVQPSQDRLRQSPSSRTSVRWSSAADSPS